MAKLSMLEFKFDSKYIFAVNALLELNLLESVLG